MAANKSDVVVPKPSDILNHLNLHIVGQTHAKRVAAVAAYNHYTRVFKPGTGSSGSEIDFSRQQASDDLEKLRDASQLTKLNKFNMFFFGPDKCGKWLLAKTLAQVFKVPIARSDQDFKSSTLDSLLKQTDNNIKKAQCGIVYLDRLSYMRPSRRSYDPNSLPKLLDRGSVIIDSEALNCQINFRLDKLLFIVKVNHEYILDSVGEKTSSNLDNDDDFVSAPGVTRADKDQYGTLMNVVMGDLRFMKEPFDDGFLDQCPVYVPFHNLTDLMRIQVIRGPLDVNFFEYEKIFSSNGVMLEFDQGAREAVALKTLEEFKNNRSYMNMRPILDKLLNRAMLDIHVSPIEKVRITKEVVLGEVKPIYVIKNN